MGQNVIIMRAMPRERGFTLVEAMITVVVLAILTAYALPSFRSFVTTQQVKSATFDIMSALVYTRSEAIKRDIYVTMTPNGASWLNGWSIAAGATNLKVGSALGSGVSVSCYQGGTAISPCPALTFNNSGHLVGLGAPSIQIGAAASTDPLSLRCIKIDLGGRPLSQKGAC